MKLILVGHPLSQRIVPASKYLTKKYLPMFDIIYLNYKGGINGWGTYVAGFLQYLTDEKIILGLDDYLVSGPIDEKIYQEASDGIGGALINAKLCECSEQEQEEYPCTTQYTIWDREFLVWLLMRISTPWEFEIEGSKILKSRGAQTMSMPCIPYFTNSSLSSRWEGIELEGLKKEDIKELKENNLL